MPKNYCRAILLFLWAMVLAACSDVDGQSAEDDNNLVQWGASNPTYLSATATVAEVINTNGIGIGATSDGELVVVDGRVLETNSAGEIFEAGADDAILIAAVTGNFSVDIAETTTESINCQNDLITYLDSLVGESEQDRIATVVISGVFSSITYVTYHGISDTTPSNTVSYVAARMIGVKTPYYFGDDSWEDNGVEVGIGEYPYHFHFLTDDETILGHIWDCEIEAGSEVKIGLVNNYDLRMDYSDN